MLSIISLTMFQFYKACGNYCVTDIIIFFTNNAHCNVCCSKFKVKKSSMFHGFIATKNELMLITIDDKLLEAIIHMFKATFLNLPHLKQVQLFVSIHIYGKFL